MKRIILSIVAILCSFIVFSQLKGDKVFIRANLGVGVGLNNISVDVVDQNFPVNSTSTFTFSPGTHFSPEFAVGYTFYDNLSAEVGLAYLIQFIYANIDGHVISINFSRMSTNLAVKYAIELKEDKFAITPGIGMLMLPSTKMKLQDGDIRQEIDYGGGFGFMASVEAQIRLGKKIMINPGVRYRIESYNAKSTTIQTVNDLQPEVKSLKANGLQFIFGIIIPILQ